MRICRVIKHLPTARAYPGGLHAYFLTRYIAEPTLIVTKRDPEEPLALPAHARVRRIAYRDTIFTSRIGGGPAGTTPGAGWRRRLARAGRCVLKVREVGFVARALPALLGFRPDVVHAHGIVSALPGVFAKACLGSRFVLSLHSTMEAELVRRSRLARACARYADDLVCVSGAVRDGLPPALDRRRIVVIPPAVDLSLFTDRGRPRRPQLVAVGHCKWQKGYAVMIDAMAALFARLPDHRLVVVGDGPERPALERRLAERGLAGRIVLAGARPQAEVAELLNESRLFVMASISEGLPKALLEAVACGTPAVVTTACNAGDFIDRVGIAVPPGDPGALADAAHALLTDEGRRAALARNCAAVAVDYDWAGMAARMARLYRRSPVEAAA
jgi:glycosyltransferase involved in cell wall biosynthesis